MYVIRRSKNTTRLINNTDKVLEIREFRGIITGENNFISAITVKARQHTNINAAKYGGDDSQGGQPSSLMIFFDGSLLRSSERDLLLHGEEFINFKTVTIDQLEDQNSTGFVNYEVKFQPRDASVRANSLKGWMRDKNLLQDGVILEDHSSMEPQDEFGFTYANPHAQVFTQASQTQTGSAPKKAQRCGKLTMKKTCLAS